MNYATELLEEQKELLAEEMIFAEGAELEQTKQRMTDVVDALNKLSIHDVVVPKGTLFCISCKSANVKTHIEEYFECLDCGREFTK